MRGSKVILKDIDNAKDFLNNGFNVPHCLCALNERGMVSAQILLMDVMKIGMMLHKECPPNVPCWMDAEVLLFMLYTSGSTGKPKLFIVLVDTWYTRPLLRVCF